MPSIADLDATIGTYAPSMVGIDIGYALRQSEVADYCAEYADSNVKESAVVALRGSDKLTAVPIDPVARDAREGRSRTGMSPYLEIVWATDLFRTHAIEMMEGSSWHIPQRWRSPREEAQYVKQVTSTRKLNGEWVTKTKDDHLFDCETMQLVLARWDSLI